MTPRTGRAASVLTLVIIAPDGPASPAAGACDPLTLWRTQWATGMSLPVGRGEARGRSGSRPRKREGPGLSGGRPRAVPACCPGESARPATSRRDTHGARSPPAWNGESPGAPRRAGAYPLPQPGILGTLADIMRPAPCEEGGLAVSLFQGNAASLSCSLASSVGGESRCRSSRQRQRKKRRHSTSTGPEALADCAFRRQPARALTRRSVRAS